MKRLKNKKLCEGCGGTGKYRKGMYINGKFNGFEGVCYRCQGKGHQTLEDTKRNNNYDNYYRIISI